MDRSQTSEQEKVYRNSPVPYRVSLSGVSLPSCRLCSRIKATGTLKTRAMFFLSFLIQFNKAKNLLPLFLAGRFLRTFQTFNKYVKLLSHLRNSFTSNLFQPG